MKLLAYLIALSFCFVQTEIVIASITIYPYGGFYMIDEDSSNFEFRITNEGEDEISYSIRSHIINNLESKSFELTDFSDDTYKSAAFDFDNDYLWVAQFSPFKLSAFDPENGDEIATIEYEDMYAYDIAWLNGRVYTNYYNEVSMWGLDEDGEIELLETFSHPDGGYTYALASDNENSWLIIKNAVNYYPIEYWTVDEDGVPDEMLGSFPTHYGWNDIYIYNLEWVPAHYDIGALWIRYNTYLYQTFVDTDTWEASPPDDGYYQEPIQIPNGYSYCAVAHDGQDIWVANYADKEIKAFDDRIDEENRISIDPQEGVLQYEEDAFINLSCDFSEALSGTYSYIVRVYTSEREYRFNLVFHVDSPAALVHGTVTFSLNGDTITNAKLFLDSYNFRRQSDENGEFQLGHLHPDDYLLKIYHEDFLTDTLQFSIDQEDEELYLEVELEPILAAPSTRNTPQEFAILSTYPNPFNSTTRISYSVPMPGMVTLKLFDVQGREVALLTSREQKAGRYDYTLDGTNLPAGIYFLNLINGNENHIRKMILMK